MRATLAACFLAGAALAAQDAGTPSIQLDVIVDASSAREPFQASDFTVTETGQAVPVVGVRLVQPAPGGAPLPPVTTADDERTAASAADRIVGLYIDEYHLDDDEAFARTREAAAAFVRRGLGPRDMVLVARPLDSLTTLRASADRDAAAIRIEDAAGRRGDRTPRTPLERQLVAGTPERVDELRRQITLSGLEAMAAHLGALPGGRKALVVVSNGLADRSLPRRVEALPGLDAVVRTANRSHVAVYAVRPHAGGVLPGASAGDGSDAPRDGVATLAEQTTGAVIDGAAGAEAGFRRVLAESSRYYLLTVSPAAPAADGVFRALSVSMRAPGTRIRARSGFAVPRQTPPAGGIRPTSLPAGYLVPRHLSTWLRPWFGVVANRTGPAHVIFAAEVVPPAATARDARLPPARLALRVNTLDEVAVFDGALAVGGAGAPPTVLSFDVEPGNYLVRVDILDATGHVLDQDVRDLRVARPTGLVGFGTPLVWRGRTLPELRRILDGPREEIAPVAVRHFVRADHLVFRIPVMSAAGDPELHARLTRYNGLVKELPLTRVEGAVPTWQADQALSVLATGPYALELEAHVPGGSARERVEFSIAP